MPTKTFFVGARPPVIDFIPGFYEFRCEVRHGGNDQMLALRMPRLRKNLVFTLNEQNAAIFSGTTLSDSIFTLSWSPNTHTDGFAFSLIELSQPRPWNTEATL